jgi:hypothetical protein
MKVNAMKMIDLPVREACFGFTGPDNHMVSLNVPAANDGGREHQFYSFDIEYDPEQPDHLTVCLMEADQDNFIRTVLKSISFPASLVAELVSRRKATAEEVAAWQASSDDDE